MFRQKHGGAVIKPLPRNLGCVRQLGRLFQIGIAFWDLNEDAASILAWSACRPPVLHIVRRPGPISVVMDMAAFKSLGKEAVLTNRRRNDSAAQHIGRYWYPTN
jgi:hypothetical protein